MEDKNGMKYATTVIMGVLPEIIFAWIVGNLLDITIWKAWLWIQVFSIVSSLVRGIVEHLVHRFVWKNTFIKGISESLSNYGYPNPKKYSFNTLAEDYFCCVKDDDEIEISTRLDAAYALGTIYARSQNGLIQSLRMESDLTEAINHFHKIKFGGKDYIEELPKYE